MSDGTLISWADYTFNPWIGCTKVSAACDFCYADNQNDFYKWNKAGWGPHAPRKRTAVSTWKKPEKWNRDAAGMGGIRPRVFCASLADVFDNHRSITSGWRGDLWALIQRTPHLDWLLLSKRPQNFWKMMPESYGLTAWGEHGWPNVWLGTTAENREEARRRIPDLLKIPAAIHFTSMEPLLEGVDLTDLPTMKFKGAERINALTGSVQDIFGLEMYRLPWKIDWVLTGGESGSQARPMHPQWPRDLRDQCAAHGTAFHHKQNGEFVSVSEVEGEGRHHRFEDGTTVRRVGKKKAGFLLDGRQEMYWPKTSITADTVVSFHEEFAGN